MPAALGQFRTKNFATTKIIKYLYNEHVRGLGAFVVAATRAHQGTRPGPPKNHPGPTGPCQEPPKSLPTPLRPPKSRQEGPRGRQESPRRASGGAR